MSRDFIMINIDDKERRFRFDLNAVADVEDYLGKEINDIFTEKGMGLRTIRALFWAGLKGQEKGLTVQRTGAILNDYLKDGGKLEDLSGMIDKSLRASYLFKGVANDDQFSSEDEEVNPNE